MQQNRRCVIGGKLLEAPPHWFSLGCRERTVGACDKTRVDEPVHSEHHCGLDFHYQRTYEAKYIRYDPRNVLSFLSKPGEVFSTFSVRPPEDMRETKFYQEHIVHRRKSVAAEARPLGGLRVPVAGAVAPRDFTAELAAGFPGD